MKRILCCFLLFISLVLPRAATAFTGDWNNQDVFIENKGQFPVVGAKDPNILYGYDNGKLLIYFRRDGFSYDLMEKKPKEDREKEKEEEERFRNEREFLEHEKEEHQAVFTHDKVYITWQGASAGVQVIADGRVNDYYNYAIRENGQGYSIDNLQAFTKLTYKNLYPDIDVEFVFHAEGGIKYSIIVHPGGDPAQVQLLYAGMKKLSLASNGDLQIGTKFGRIIDRAPLTFYADDHNSVIASQFVKDGKTVSFLLGDYDHNRTIVIDPWQQTAGLGFGNSNKVWECEHDNSGNSYFWGGDTPMRLKKFNSAGTLQWTYNSPWDTANFWVGTFITDNNGNSYCTGGSNGEISKVSTAGAQQWYNNPNGLFGPLFEYWHLAFNCDQTQLVVGGMRAPNPFSIANYRGVVITINLANGAVTGFTPVGYVAGITIKEVRSICPAASGGYYFLTLDSIGMVNTSIALQWKTTSTYNFGYGIPSYGVTNQGISAIRANANFIYTQDGNTLDKRSTANGAIITSVAIPGGISTSSFGVNTPGNSGLDIDSCGNVYVGSGNQIIKYDANLNVLSTQATPAAVYDVSVSRNGEVVACGQGFMGTYNMSACNPIRAICVTSVLAASSSSTNVNCFGQCTGTATASPTGGTAPYTYLWAPSGGNAATATGLCAGGYTCTITDNVGATTTTSVNITQPASALSVAPASQTNISCNGGSNGAASVTASGGTSAYTYNWTPGNPTGDGTNSVTNLGVGSWTCTVTDANGCTTTQTFNITQPTAISASANATPTGCSASTGSATATASGGTGTLTYSWAPSGGNAATASNLAAGGYTCTITDANGCSTTASATVTTTSGPTVSLQSSSNVTCNAGNNGSATVNASGNGPFTYSWAPSGGNAATASNLTAGSYTCTITDANNCTSTQIVSITEPTAISASASSTPTGCSASTGSATATASGGTGTLTYSWAPSGGNAATANNLAAGGYTCTITDANGCSTTTSTTVTSTGGPTVNLQSSTDATCFGSSNGDATVNATGNGPFTYSWTPSGGSAATATGLPAGGYTCTITDVNGCLSTQTVTITEPTQVAGSTSATPATCGNNDGSASVIASGGTGSYTYSWAPSGGTNATENNIGAGNYTVTITDANGCSNTATVNVSSSGGPTVNLQSSNNANCFGASTGDATVNATGNGPFTYAWAPSGGNAATATGLPAGTYTCTITDANGCVSTQAVTITEPAQVTGTTTVVPASCGNNNGSATVTASGGTGSYTYSWAPSGGSGATASGLGAGTYTCTITDANGCTNTATAIVTNSNGPTVSLQSSTNITCFNGSNGAATVNATGNGPFTYSWSPSGGTAATASGLSAGTYTCTITDANGCITTQTVTLTQPATGISATSATVPEDCGNGNGSATITASGGTPTYTYLWNTNATTATISNLSAGLYTVQITDANGCTTTATVTVPGSGYPTANAGNSVTIQQGQSTTLNGSGGGTYSWTPSGGLSCTSCQNPTASPSVTTVYYLTVTDSLGCTDVDSMIVYVDITCGQLYLPNAFSPNGDYENDVLYVRGNCIQYLEFSVYNRWGEKVFETTDPALGWDGSWRGQPCESAVFSYVLRATLLDGTEIEKQGSITLVK